MNARHSDLLGPRSVRRGIGPRRTVRRDSRGGGGWHFRPGWRTVLLLLVALLTVGLVYTATMVGVAVNDITEPVSEEVAPEARPAPVRAGERINILAMGLDEEGLRSDTMMLVSVDLEERRVAVIQIPRDTRALLAGKGTIEKINAAYAYGVGDRRFPANLRALKTVEDLLDIPVHHTVVVELDAFRKAVDLIGGVWVEIPFKMDYDDPTQNLHIHLEPGRQKLDGQKALEFVRWRRNNDGTGYPDGDLGRIRAQQQFLRAAISQVLRPGNLINLPNLARELAQYVETTMDGNLILSLAKVAAQIRPEDVAFATLPGVDSYIYDPQMKMALSFYVPDPVETRRLVDRMIHGIDPEVAATIHVQLVAPDLNDQVDWVRKRLTEQGFAVSVSLDAVEPAAKTRVIDLRGDEEVSQFVGRALLAQGLQSEILKQLDPEAMADVRVVLATDGPGR